MMVQFCVLGVGVTSWLSYGWLLCLHMTEGLSVSSFTFQMFLIVVKVT